ncbi:unnamed protein product, partial [Musa textilis]
LAFDCYAVFLLWPKIRPQVKDYVHHRSSTQIINRWDGKKMAIEFFISESQLLRSCEE